MSEFDERTTRPFSASIPLDGGRAPPETAVEHLEELSSVMVKGDSWRVFRIMGEFVEGSTNSLIWDRLSPSSARPGRHRRTPSIRSAWTRPGFWGKRAFPSLPGVGPA